MSMKLLVWTWKNAWSIKVNGARSNTILLQFFHFISEMHHKISRIVVSNYIRFDWMGGIDLESTVPGNLIPLGAYETTGYRIKHLSVAKPESDSLPNHVPPCSVLGCATFNLTDPACFNRIWPDRDYILGYC